MRFPKSRRRAVLGVSLSVIVIGTILVASLDHAFSATNDLMVEYLTWKPEHPVSGGLLSIDGRVRNVGDTLSSDKYTVSVYVDDWWVDGWLFRMTGFQPKVSPKVSPGRTQVWHFSISDHMVLKAGDHEIKAVVSEPNDLNSGNDELVKTVSISQGHYRSDFSIVNYGICNRIDEDDLPLGITENYGLDDELAISYFYTDLKHTDWKEKIGQETNLTFRLFSPNGTLHGESTGYSILLSTDPNGREVTGFALQLFISKDLQAQGREGDPLYDPGYQALGKFPGAWRVEVLSEGNTLFVKRFIIEDESSNALSATSALQLASTSASRSEQASIKDLGSMVPGGYATVLGTVAFVAALGCVVLLKRRKR